MYFSKWNDPLYSNGSCLCFTFSSVNYFPNAFFFMDFKLSTTDLTWSASVFMWEGEGCTGGIIPAHHQHRRFLYSSSNSCPSKPQHLVRATEHPPGACAWHVLCSSVPSFSWRKLSPPPELAGKNCSPGDDSDEPGRAAAPPPPGAAISLPWWMLQPPPAVSQRQEQEQHWTACLQMMQCCWFASSIALELDSDRTGICDLSTEIYRSYWVARFSSFLF